MKQGRLQGQSAVVTGALGSVGREIARVFVAEGARVGLVDHLAEKLERVANSLRAADVVVHFFAADVTRDAEVESAVADMLSKLGSVNILVNNSGVTSITPFVETSEAIWEHVFAANVTSAFLMSQTVIPHMLRDGSGKIINVGGELGRRGASWHVAESAAKSALVGLTQGLADEFGDEQIRVNAICPGVVKDQGWVRHAAAYAQKYNVSPEEVESLLLRQIPLGRLATPEDVARCALFLASEDAAYITGQAIILSGGKTM